MNARELTQAILNRRGFFKTTSAGLAAAGMAMGGQATPNQNGAPVGNAGSFANSSNPATRELTEKEKLDRIASNTWPIRDIFQTAGTRTNAQVDAMKKKYGEITMLDFPDFTKTTFPGVYHMDLFSGLFGDVTDPSMFAAPAGRGGAAAAATPPATAARRPGQGGAVGVRAWATSIPPAPRGRSGSKRWRTRWRPRERSASTFQTTPQPTFAWTTSRRARPASRWPRTGWMPGPSSGQNRCA